MAVEETMTINERRLYLKRMLPRYRTAHRAERGRLLTEMEAMTGMHRKSLLRLLAAPSLARRPRRTTRKRIYGDEIAAIIAVVWESLDYVCAERLTPVLVETASHLATFGELTLTPTLCEQLAGISRATVGRMLPGMRRPTPRLPFPIRHLHPDNGSEFFNHHLVRFWGEEITGLTLSRSRPYQKNDNRFVEQKNDTLVRAYVGYDRLDTIAQRDALNLLYEQLWVYYNLFQPVLHLIAKERQANRVIRKWDDAQTPYQRLVTAGGIDEATQTRLAALYAATNPRHLRREIYAGLARLWESETTAMLAAD